MKLDLHTHCLEATLEPYPGFKVVRKIVTKAKEQGLDGIAVTEHLNRDYAYRVMELVASSFDNEIKIIPGQELSVGPHHIVELYLPDNSTFRFIAHPWALSSQQTDWLKGIHGIEIENGNWVIDQEKVRQFAQRRGLLLLSNSDAHTISDIGRHYNEIDIEELCRRARGFGANPPSSQP